MKHDPIPTPPSADDPPRSGPRWTTRKMAEFLRALAATHSVKAAAEAVGMSRQSAYRLRARLKGLAFDAAWDEAFHHSYHNLPYLALERAMHGVEVPHYHKGELVGTSLRFDERLTVALLRMFTTGDALIVGGLDPAPELTGRRLEALIGRIEAEGEAALDAPGAARSGDSHAASALSDDEIMAEFRRFRRKARG
jgi:hypothetical protein